jgi:3-hydroxyisobutyrate dehydrogenase-like beta-hydroxyacid dehydrogenase
LSRRIGFIGLGVMGSRMAQNLLKAGYEVVVYNRSRPAVEELVKHGAIDVGSPRAMAGDTGTIVLSLPSSAAVEETVLGEWGLVHGLSQGGVVIDTSTIDLAVSARLADELKKRGSYLLDAPVSGGPERAASGTLSIMAGGDRGAFERSEAVLRAMGSSVFYLGESGSGLKMKLFNQALVGVYFVAVAETYLLSEKLGMDLEDIKRVISVSWGDSPPFRHFVDVLQSGDFKAGALVRNLKKDLGIVLGTAEEEGASMTMAQLAYSHIARASEMGRDDYDVASIFQVLGENKPSEH